MRPPYWICRPCLHDKSERIFGSEDVFSADIRDIYEGIKSLTANPGGYCIGIFIKNELPSDATEGELVRKDCSR